MGRTPKPRKQTKEQPVLTEKQRRNRIELEAWKLALKKTRKTKVLLVAVLVMSVLGITFGIRSVNQVTAFSNATLAKVKELNTGSSRGRQAALQAVNAWLTGKNTPFPDGYSNLWWDNAVLVDTETDSDGVQTQYWSHELSFTDLSDGSTRNITQLVSTSGELSEAVGAPTILSKPSTSTSTSNKPPTGYATLEQPTTLSDSLKAWAKAYVGKDTKTLGVAISDPNPQHVYQPAEVGVFQQMSIEWMVACDKDGQPLPKDSEQTVYGAASLTISFIPYYTATNADGTPKDKPAAATMSVTVMVANPTTGSAHVVDWGANSLVKQLRPYANAMDASLVSAKTEDDTDADAAVKNGGTSDGSDAEGADGQETAAKPGNNSNPTQPKQENH